MKSHENPLEHSTGRVARLSVWLGRLATTMIAMIALFCLAVLVVPGWFADMVRLAYPDLVIAGGIGWFKVSGLVVLAAFPVAATLYGLWNIRLLFGCYARGVVFDDRPARLIGRVGIAMILNSAFAFVARVLGGLLLTYDNPAGQRQLIISLSSDQLIVLLTGGLLIVIGLVMREANRITDENRQFV